MTPSTAIPKAPPRPPLRVHVFVDRKGVPVVPYVPPGSPLDQSLDQRVAQAADRLLREFGVQVEIIYHDQNDHTMRQQFGISRLPAIALTDTSFDAEAKERPSNLPAAWKLWRRAERRKVLAGGHYAISMQRPILEHPENDEHLYFLLRDLMTTYVDRGLEGVAQAVEGQIRGLFGANAVKNIVATKKFFF